MRERIRELESNLTTYEEMYNAERDRVLELTSQLRELQAERDRYRQALAKISNGFSAEPARSIAEKALRGE